jgi:hypothetical protein
MAAHDHRNADTRTARAQPETLDTVDRVERPLRERVSATDYTWPSQEVADQHLADGRVLVGALQDELGDGYVVLFEGDEDPPMPSREALLEAMKVRFGSGAPEHKGGPDSGSFTLRND